MTCKEGELCPYWEKCPFQHDVNKCRLSFDVNAEGEQVERID